MVGAEIESLDCWKQIVHDTSKTPSKGIKLNDLVNNNNIVEFYQEKQKIIIDNKWNETFELSNVIFNKTIFLHAKKI